MASERNSPRIRQTGVVVNLPTSSGQDPVRRSQRIDQAGLHNQTSSMTVASQSGRQEANTLARVRQLQKEGLWTDKKSLQKISKPECAIQFTALTLCLQMSSKLVLNLDMAF